MSREKVQALNPIRQRAYLGEARGVVAADRHGGRAVAAATGGAEGERREGLLFPFVFFLN
jgi:hypothetical protein